VVPERRKVKRAKALLLLLFVVLAVTAAGLSCAPPGTAASERSPVTGWQIGNVAPDFTLADIDGKSVSLSDYRGKPVLINFWATWCPPCVQETPFLQQIYDQQAGKGLVFLAVNIEENPAKVREFFAKNTLSLPVLFDFTGSTTSKYGVSSIPSTFFVDGSGVIRRKVVGAFPSVKAIETELRSIMPR
jgi:peroxiredoxin